MRVKSGELGCHEMDLTLPNSLVGKVLLELFRRLNPNVVLPCLAGI
jgi:hypothetical protein